MSEILINIKIVNPKKSSGIFGNLDSVQVISEHAQKSLKKFARAKVASDCKGDF